jgi:hypothetical protein
MPQEELERQRVIEEAEREQYANMLAAFGQQLNPKEPDEPTEE